MTACTTSTFHGSQSNSITPLITPALRIQYILTTDTKANGQPVIHRIELIKFHSKRRSLGYSPSG